MMTEESNKMSNPEWKHAKLQPVVALPLAGFLWR